MPSPIPEQPGLMLRDPFRYSDHILVVPPPLVQCLALFDGEHTEADLRTALVEVTGELIVQPLLDHLVQSLSGAGFLHDETFERLRVEKHLAFAREPVRDAEHAGSGYPDEAPALSEQLREYLEKEAPSVRFHDGLLGIAAPHVSPFGGWKSYQAAYRALEPKHADRTFVVLGTSHYGMPNRFGLTRKPFVTPFGQAETDTALVDEIERKAPDALVMEDYCHAIEHSIEFQVIFLQHLFGPGIRILPVLCGSYARSIYQGGAPEDDPGVERFLGVMGEIAARESQRLLWVLGIDMAHIGRRYGDRLQARADQGEMVAVAARDRARIERIAEGDIEGFWGLVQERHDDLKWCGSSPLYTFLRAVPQARGELMRYEQWNIDQESVVSFAGIAFRPAG